MGVAAGGWLLLQMVVAGTGDPPPMPNWGALKTKRIQALRQEQGTLETPRSLTSLEQEVRNRAQQGSLPVAFAKQSDHEWLLLVGTSGGIGVQGLVMVEPDPARVLPRLRQSFSDLVSSLEPLDREKWRATLDRLSDDELAWLVANRPLSRAWVGAGLVCETQPRGVRLTRIEPNGPAAKVSLVVGDVITHVEKTAVATPQELWDTLEDYGEGSWVVLRVMHAPALEARRVRWPASHQPAGGLAAGTVHALDEKVRREEGDRLKQVKAVREELQMLEHQSDEAFAETHRPIFNVFSVSQMEGGPGSKPINVREGFNIDVQIGGMQYAFILEPTRQKSLEGLKDQYRAIQHPQQGNFDPDEATAYAIVLNFLSNMTDEEFEKAHFSAFQTSSSREELEQAGISPGTPRKEWAWIGAMVRPLSPQELRGIQHRGGLAVAFVVSKSEAEKAGLAVGDILLSVERHPLQTPQALAEALQKFSPGAQVRLEVWRGGRMRIVRLMLESMPQP